MCDIDPLNSCRLCRRTTRWKNLVAGAKGKTSVPPHNRCRVYDGVIRQHGLNTWVQIGRDPKKMFDVGKTHEKAERNRAELIARLSSPKRTSGQNKYLKDKRFSKKGALHVKERMIAVLGSHRYCEQAHAQDGERSKETDASTKLNSTFMSEIIM